MRLGSDFRNQMCATGAASSIWPMRSRRTRAERHFDRALLADDALVLHALVLAAQALVVLDRPEDARAEQAVTLRLEGAVVDGFRLFDLAVGPRQNLLRARDRDPDLVEDLSRRPAGLKRFIISWFIVFSSTGVGGLRPSSKFCRTCGAGRSEALPAPQLDLLGRFRGAPACAAWNCAGRR